MFEQVLILAGLIGGLVALGVGSALWGVDSREGFERPDREILEGIQSHHS